jgi:hypothetical protein
VDPIGPGETSEASVSFSVSEGSPLASVLESGALKLGMSITIPETSGFALSVVVNLIRLEVRISGRPFLLIP